MELTCLIINLMKLLPLTTTLAINAHLHVYTAMAADWIFTLMSLPISASLWLCNLHSRCMCRHANPPYCLGNDPSHISKKICIDLLVSCLQGMMKKREWGTHLQMSINNLSCSGVNLLPSFNGARVVFGHIEPGFSLGRPGSTLSTLFFRSLSAKGKPLHAPASMWAFLTCLVVHGASCQWQILNVRLPSVE